ncbi:MAG: energy transducer TonB [Gammaproteobacteria bacterium]|nr:MAG: energy transducer TonB [Gammaproteobacteria bacterium]
MSSGGLKWFLALSAAVHTVVLVTWTQPEADAGNPGRVIKLEMIEMAGVVTSEPAETVAYTAQEPANTAPQAASAIRKTPVRTTVKKPVRTTETAATQPVEKPETVDSGTRDNIANDIAIDTRTPSAAVAARSPERSREEADRHLRNTILELFATNLKYPPLARRKGWQGIVILTLRIESNGRISRLHVNETSGYPVLDRAAVESLQLASVPRAEEWLDGEPVDIIVPVEYRLVDS